jgi:transcriptional regulator with XRE-family HTH domain
VSATRAQNLPVMMRRTFIREWRNREGLTLQELAERIGIDHSYLSRVERGARPYNQWLLETIGRVLGVDPASLLARNPYDQESVWEIANRISRLPSPIRKQALAILDALASAE